MNTLKILIVEDERGTALFIKKVIHDNCAEMTVVGLARSVQSAFHFIQKDKPDILLLDVELGDGTAFDLLQKLNNQTFITIFLTAYQGYTLQAIKFSAFDYILKPFKPKELIDTLKRAVEKANKENNNNRKISVDTLLNNLSTPADRQKKILLKTGSDIHLVKIGDIVYCEADSSYTHFHLMNSEIITISNGLKEFETLLSVFDFIRTHHGFLVNIDHIKRYHKTGHAYLQMENGDKVPVSTRNKEKVSSVFKRL